MTKEIKRETCIDDYAAVRDPRDTRLIEDRNAALYVQMNGSMEFGGGAPPEIEISIRSKDGGIALAASMRREAVRTDAENNLPPVSDFNWMPKTYE